MPILSSQYPGPPFYLFNGDLETIIPGGFRKVRGIAPERERIVTRDGDFLLLDWVRAESPSGKLVIVTHGLEGHSRRPYVTGVLKKFVGKGYDALSWNFRGAGGEINKSLKMYHHGFSEDLERVVDHALSSGRYHLVVFVGFSLGGNMTLNYLAKEGLERKEIKGGVAVSVPCDLTECVEVMSRPKASFYHNRFLRKLKAKLRDRVGLFPENLKREEIDGLRDFYEFDNYYTAPVFGFKDAFDYYASVSTLEKLPKIEVPVLVLNAKNDPFLGANSFPYDIAEANDHVFLETPERGGHCGFLMKGKSETWAEIRAFDFLEPLARKE
ncbi:alpha/beta hydrolase [Fulvitalea axinellae]|uniref:Alpha/beta hydrolase n=1 Tax=Fulvitalea axinellae TaxID=1182444 RepID=A0AAU9CRW0_9BACT|nr:alpha/beta hydrolase [Fulvitalea axinellae]